jgi:hypothetical protein
VLGMYDRLINYEAYDSFDYFIQFFVCLFIFIINFTVDTNSIYNIDKLTQEKELALGHLEAGLEYIALLEKSLENANQNAYTDYLLSPLNHQIETYKESVSCTL